MTEKLPFKENLIRSNIDNASNKGLFEFEENKTKIIREFPLKNFPPIFNNELNKKDSISKAKKLFDEVREEYNINVPVDYVIGKNVKDSDVIYIITDRIEGDNLNKIEVLPENKDKIIAELHELFGSLIQYIKDKYALKEWMMWDIANGRQYVYGKKTGENEEKLYLIDTDLKYAEKATNFVFTYLSELVRFISSMEHKLGIRFTKERGELTSFLKEINPDDKKFQDFNISAINATLDI